FGHTLLRCEIRSVSDHSPTVTNPARSRQSGLFIALEIASRITDPFLRARETRPARSGQRNPADARSAQDRDRQGDRRVASDTYFCQGEAVVDIGVGEVAR